MEKLVKKISFKLSSVAFKAEFYDAVSGGLMPSPAPEVEMHVEIKDPHDRVIISRVYEGKLCLQKSIIFFF